MYECEICGLPRDGKSPTNNSGPHACVTALRTRLEEAERQLATAREDARREMGRDITTAMLGMVDSIGFVYAAKLNQKISDLLSTQPTPQGEKCGMCTPGWPGRVVIGGDRGRGEFITEPCAACHPRPQPTCGGSGAVGAGDMWTKPCPGCPDCQPNTKGGE